VLLGLVALPLAKAAAWLVWPFLTYFAGVVNLSGKASWAFLETGELSVWWAVGYYLVVGYWLWRLRKRRQLVTPGVGLRLK